MVTNAQAKSERAGVIAQRLIRENDLALQAQHTFVGGTPKDERVRQIGTTADFFAETEDGSLPEKVDLLRERMRFRKIYQSRRYAIFEATGRDREGKKLPQKWFFYAPTNVSHAARIAIAARTLLPFPLRNVVPFMAGSLEVTEGWRTARVREVQGNLAPAESMTRGLAIEIMRQNPYSTREQLEAIERIEKEKAAKLVGGAVARDHGIWREKLLAAVIRHYGARGKKLEILNGAGHANKSAQIREVQGAPPFNARAFDAEVVRTAQKLGAKVEAKAEHFIVKPRRRTVREVLRVLRA